MMPRVEMRDAFGTMFRIDTGIPADTRYISQPFNIPRDPARALDALAARRAWIDEQIKANQR
jgi:hypothetical protein